MAQADFDEVLGLIDAARTRAVAAVNTSLIDLYWSIGEYITPERLPIEGWGQGTVESLAEHIQRHQPKCTRFLGPQSLADDAVCRDLSATSQNSHRWCVNCPGATTLRDHEPVQPGGGAESSTCVSANQ